MIKKEHLGYCQDIWSLGCILYELITLETIFESDNPLKLVQKIVELDPLEIYREKKVTLKSFLDKDITSDACVQFRKESIEKTDKNPSELNQSLNTLHLNNLNNLQSLNEDKDTELLIMCFDKNYETRATVDKLCNKLSKNLLTELNKK
eukprot:CAMPEP_0116961360 /NCGR_PEP_ID=MMETSP0467-20121206/46522_1 /TAXON_ID=283647 /ORGANISM="Mesodinium pulex, Strain SPMC105" /LENGTH=148 /DNA_ID=CAMNT_0004649289 /DNA_START=122 /DNA_END=568 /DNA_ORIENTATION=-